MFSGIVEALGRVKSLQKQEGNLELEIACAFSKELKIDQSIAHNGVCLTVTSSDDESYKVTAIQETLKRSNLGLLEVGDIVNLERCITLHSYLDGHLVQGHVDTMAECTSVNEDDGSWIYQFAYEAINPLYITVEKGSVTVNGVSLTVVESRAGFFSVAIIPYTWEHTNFKHIRVGTKVNLEFDIIGKYVATLMKNSGILPA
jgi:riboflavin synthase